MNDYLQSVGIDIAKEKFDVCFKERKNGSSVIKGTKTFKNDSKGFSDFNLWYSKRRKEGSQLVFVMEATGVYYEELAYFLHAKNEAVYVELPQKVKYFAKSLNIKTKTDKVDAKGNAHLRSALYMPAVTAATHNENLNKFYSRLNEKFNYKKQSLVAVMRKLLVLIYTLWKSGEDYDPNYQWGRNKDGRFPSRH